MHKIEPFHQYQETTFTQEQVEIIRNTICKNSSDDEFKVFLMACQKTRLDPFMRQIYAVKRWDNRLKRETMTIQTGIDGFRLIAERTEKYAPGPKPTFSYDENGNLMSATAYVKKLTNDGTWHIVEAEAFLDEYCQRDKNGNTIGMWVNMQRNQLAKCAESLALRKAFPAEMCGIYTQDEMKQAEMCEINTHTACNVIPVISFEQTLELQKVLDECSADYRNWLFDRLVKKHNVKNLQNLPQDIYEAVLEAAKNQMKQEHQKQQVEYEQKVDSE